jgi:hypothetical protein
MELTYRGKEIVMQQLFEKYLTPAGFRSTYKGVPMDQYENIKQFIDFTKYYVMFRGPRPNRWQNSTRKRDAKAFDVYQRSERDTRLLRTEREAFQRGVKWANNRSH